MQLLEQHVHTSVNVSTASGDRTMLWCLRYNCLEIDDIPLASKYMYVEKSFLSFGIIEVAFGIVMVKRYGSETLPLTPI